LYTVLGVVAFVLALAASIGLHEIGHMVPAKKFGVRVPQFMVGFGPTLWSRQRGETEYGVKAIPLGGYIRMIGMYPPAKITHHQSHTRRAQLIDEARVAANEEVGASELNRTFYNLSVPKKLAVMFGGPFMNLVIAAFLLALVTVGIGTPRASLTVSSLTACVPTAANPSGTTSTDGTCHGSAVSPSVRAGIQPGDVITRLDGVAMSQWSQLGATLSDKAGKSIVVSYQRAGKSISTQVVIARVPTSLLGTPTESAKETGFLGVSPQVTYVRGKVTGVPSLLTDMSRQAISGLATFPGATWHMARDTVTGHSRSLDSPVSVVGIGRISGQIAGDSQITVKDRAGSLLLLLASLNLFLFLFNLLPILPLDGGHIAGALYEGARRQVARLRRRPNPGPVDTARMVPLAYVASIALIVLSLITVLADLINPISF